MAWTWSDSIDFECAREAINHLVAIRVAERAQERAKAIPDAQRLQQLEADIRRLGHERRFLEPGTPEVERVRCEYGALVRASLAASETPPGADCIARAL